MFSVKFENPEFDNAQSLEARKRFTVLARMANNTSKVTLRDAALDQAVDDLNEIYFEHALTSELEYVLVEGLRLGCKEKSQLFDFWKSNFYLPRIAAEDEKKRRLDESQFVKELAQGKYAVPLSTQIWRRVGGLILCNCAPLPDGVRPAAVCALSGGKFWTCATASCNFRVDAENENAVRAVAVAPKANVSSVNAALPDVAALVAKAAKRPQTFLDRFVDKCDIDLDACDPVQLTGVRQMAKWWEVHHSRVELNRENYERLHAQWSAAA